jgi:O-antigen/teichoic acid export membrane protein
LTPFNRLLLGYMISPAAVAIYEIADRGAQVIRGIAEKGLRPYMPRISGLQALADLDQIREMTVRLVKGVIIWCIPIFFLFFLIADELVAFWLRTSGTAAISGNLRLILWAYYFNLLSVPVYYAFMGLGLVGPLLPNIFPPGLDKCAGGPSAGLGHRPDLAFLPHPDRSRQP